MTFEQQRSKAFHKVQPICVLITTEPTYKNIILLHEELKTVDKELIPDLQEYIIFPLRLVFKQINKIQEDVYIAVSECLQFIFNNGLVNNWHMFQDLFSTICLFINPPQQSRLGTPLSEELILALIKTLTALVNHTQWSTLVMLYEAASLPALGHGVSMLLQEAELERSRNIQVAAMTCLDSLAQTHSKVCKSERMLLGDVFASFLPGIALTLTRVITGDQKQGHSVIVKGLDTWSRIVCLVINNDILDGSHQDNKHRSSTNVNEKIKDLIITRNSEWIQSTSDKIMILLKQILSIRTSTNWRVRMALVDVSDLLLTKSNKCMKDSVPILLDVLVGYIGDEYPNIRNRCSAVLNQFKGRQSDVTDTKALQEILADNLHSLTTSLPRQIRMADEEEKLLIVNLLNGYLSLLGEDINKVLRSAAHLKRLFLSLVQCLELDCSDVKIIEQHTLTIESSGLLSLSDITKPNKVFRHFRDEKIQHGLFQTCQLLGQHGNLDLVIDHMLDIFNETSVYRLQSIMIINNIISGTGTLYSTQAQEKQTVSNERISSLVRMLIDDYLSDTNFNLPISNTIQELTHAGNVKKELTVANMNHNIMQICLLTEGIGTFAKVLKQDFDCMLMDVIYPLLDKLGQQNTYINHTAYISLVDICTACNYSSIDELICLNADYLVNTISLKLRHFTSDYQAPLVLQVIIQYCSADIIPLIHDTISEILQSLDDNYDKETGVYLRVLRELILSIIKWFPPKAANKNNNSSIEDLGPDLNYPEKDKYAKLSLPEIETFFLDYHKNKEISEGCDDTEDGIEDEGLTAESEGADADNNTDSKQLPYHITAVKQVLTRTKHLLSSKNGRHRLLVLEIIKYSCISLHSQQDELLPLLHEVWLPFALRFKDEEKLVTVKAMETLKTMADNSGDFLMKRTLKDVVPCITNYLVNQSKISLNSGTMYTYSVNYKLQLVYLQQLGPLALMLKIGSYDLDVIVSSCVSYLNKHQPKQLQEACINSFDSFIKLESDIVWLLLTEICSSYNLQPPSSLFKPVLCKKTGYEVSDYKDNTDIVLLKT